MALALEPDRLAVTVTVVATEGLLVVIWKDLNVLPVGTKMLEGTARMPGWLDRNVMEAPPVPAGIESWIEQVTVPPPATGFGATLKPVTVVGRTVRDALRVKPP